MTKKKKEGINLQTRWTPPTENGVAMLTMPNIPLPLHQLNPRNIMGSYEWGKLRKQCYEDAGDICEICGAKLGKHRGDPLMHQAHEAYDIDFTAYTSTFVRLICLCPRCHSAIHSGRALTCYHNHEPLWDKEYMLSLAEHLFSQLDQWNRQHPDSEPLRAYETVLSWLDEPSLTQDLQKLIDQYHIEFWAAPDRKDWDNAWGKWRLIYDGTEYWSPYQSREQWEQEVDGHSQDDLTSLFQDDVFKELRENIKDLAV